jgi:hypothetical protein
MSVAFLLTLSTNGFVLTNPVRRSTGGYYGYADTQPWAPYGENGSHFNLSRVVVRWHDGRHDDSYRDSDGSLLGLAGGITWALHPQFCQDMIPLFKDERLFFGALPMMGCGELRDAVANALDSWASNHRLIDFHDVTDACAQEDVIVDGGTKCLHAEMLIRSESMSGSRAGRAAYVYLDYTDAIRAPRSTTGDVIVQGIGITGAEMSVATNLCWYMDATFCSFFHRVVDENELQPYVFSGAIGLFVVSTATVLFLFLRANTIATNSSSVFLCVRPRRGSIVDRDDINGVHDVDPFTEGARDSIVRAKKEMCRCSLYKAVLALCTALYTMSCCVCIVVMRKKSLRTTIFEIGLTALHMPLFTTLICIFVMVFMPVFYFTVFLPCYECHDFEATIAHEAGHVLGFHHPDSQTGQNLVLKRPLNEVSYCADPLYRDVVLREHPVDEDTIMMSQTDHRPRTCLTQDDYNGLHALYPSCEPLANQQPVCVDTFRYSGLMRFSLSVSLPFIVATAALLGMQCMARCVQRRRVRALESRVVHASVQQRMLRASCAAAQHAKEQAEQTLASTLERLQRPSQRKRNTERDSHESTTKHKAPNDKTGRVSRWAGGVSHRAQACRPSRFFGTGVGARADHKDGRAAKRWVGAFSGIRNDRKARQQLQPPPNVQPLANVPRRAMQHIPSAADSDSDVSSSTVPGMPFKPSMFKAGALSLFETHVRA